MSRDLFRELPHTGGIRSPGEHEAMVHDCGPVAQGGICARASRVSSVIVRVSSAIPRNETRAAIVTSSIKTTRGLVFTSRQSTRTPIAKTPGHSCAFPTRALVLRIGFGVMPGNVGPTPGESRLRGARIRRCRWLHFVASHAFA